jgi:hypothetical protein
MDDPSFQCGERHEAINANKQYCVFWKLSIAPAGSVLD